MNEVTETLAVQGMSGIVAEVARALKDAAKDYGPEAVDLALLAYRVSAVQTIVVGLLCLPGVYAIWRGGKHIWNVVDASDSKDRDAARILTCIFGGVVACGLFLGAAVNLTNVAVWAAAFGAPELLIATKALQAAGLL